jgi:lysosomal alpha-mannosidase
MAWHSPHLLVEDRVGGKDYENSKRKKEMENKKKVEINKKILSRPHMDKTFYVHMVPHTHDDLGWLKTVDEYYTGSDQESHHATVELVLDSVVEQMSLRPQTKFTYVEMKYFAMWWERQPKEIKDKLK